MPNLLNGQKPRQEGAKALNNQCLRLTGARGGQGVILASVILAEAAVIAGKYTAQSQSYGPEARGGSCKAECIISDNEIGFTKIVHPTFLMALTQKALEQYAVNLPKDALVLIDDSLTVPESLSQNKVCALPILRTAKEEVGIGHDGQYCCRGSHQCPAGHSG